MRPTHDFQIWKSSNSQYYFVYYDGNRQALVQSETYVTLESAQRGLANFKTEMRMYS